MKQLEDIAKEINDLVNKKLRKKSLDITGDLNTIKDRITIIKEDLSDERVIRFADYLIQKCEEFKISVDKKDYKFSFQ